MTAIDPDIRGEGMRIGIVWSRFNEDIVRELLTACDRELVNLGVLPTDIDVVSVPGALELPLALQVLALERKAFGRRYDALVALGAWVVAWWFLVFVGQCIVDAVHLRLDKMI